MEEFADGRHYPFHLIIEDPSGNSFVQNPNAPNKDNLLKTEYFPRTVDFYETMGYNPDASKEQSIVDAMKFTEEDPNRQKTQVETF